MRKCLHDSRLPQDWSSIDTDYRTPVPPNMRPANTHQQQPALRRIETPSSSWPNPQIQRRRHMSAQKKSNLGRMAGTGKKHAFYKDLLDPRVQFNPHYFSTVAPKPYIPCVQHVARHQPISERTHFAWLLVICNAVSYPLRYRKPHTRMYTTLPTRR